MKIAIRHLHRDAFFEGDHEDLYIREYGGPQGVDNILVCQKDREIRDSSGDLVYLTHIEILTLNQTYHHSAIYITGLLHAYRVWTREELQAWMAQNPDDYPPYTPEAGWESDLYDDGFRQSHGEEVRAPFLVQVEVYWP